MFELDCYYSPLKLPIYLRELLKLATPHADFALLPETLFSPGLV